MLYLIYPLIDRICKKPWMEIGLALGCLLVYEVVQLPTLFEINRVVYYIPYFVLGRYLVRLFQSEKVNSHWINIVLFAVALVAFVILDRLCDVYPEMAIIKYVRAIAMILTVYVVGHYLLRWSDSGSKAGNVFVRFLNNCSKFSLQLYLFNGFILVAIRTLIVSVLHIHNPVVIVSSIVIANLLITLLICNYVLPKTRWIAWLCGIGDRPWRRESGEQ